MPPLITRLLSSVLLASYCCYALPNPTFDNTMGTPMMNTVPTNGGSESSSAAAAAAAAATSSGSSGQNQPNCSPPPVNPPCPPPVNPPCPPPVNPPCPPPVNPPCPPPVNPPCPPPFNPPPSPPPFNPCPPPCPPGPHPPTPTCPPPNCSPSPNCPSPSTGSSSSSAAAAASASASGSAASASATASASTTVQVPNLQKLCSYPTDVQQCSSIYSQKYQHTEFQKIHNKMFYIHYASKSTQQISFDSAQCFEFSVSQNCHTVMVKYMVESTTSITKIIWGSNSSGQLSYVKTSVKVISQEYAVMQDTFSEAQKVTSGSTTAMVSTETEQLSQFISSSPYVLMYSDYEHVLAMKRCSDSAMFVAVCDKLYEDQQQLQMNAMSAIQSIMNFHQIDMSSCSTLTQRFSMDISSITITSASFEMSKTNDGTMISGNKIERQDGNSLMTGETSVSRGLNGDVNMSSSTSTNVSAGTTTSTTPSCPPSPPPSPATGSSAASASAAASATAASS